MIWGWVHRQGKRRFDKHRLGKNLRILGEEQHLLFYKPLAVSRKPEDNNPRSPEGDPTSFPGLLLSIRLEPAGIQETVKKPQPQQPTLQTPTPTTSTIKLVTIHLPPTYNCRPEGSRGPTGRALCCPFPCLTHPHPQPGFPRVSGRRETDTLSPNGGTRETEDTFILSSLPDRSELKPTEAKVIVGSARRSLSHPSNPKATAAKLSRSELRWARKGWEGGREKDGRVGVAKA